MKNTITDAKVRTRAQEKTADAIKVQDAVYSGPMAVVGVASSLIGLWAAACFVGGLVASGGPITFIKSWFTAVAGS